MERRRRSRCHPSRTASGARARRQRRQRAAARLHRRGGRRAARKRHGMTRREFLRTAAGTATAYMVLNTVHGLDRAATPPSCPSTQGAVRRPGAARELLRQAEYFVMDVQLHHVDLETFRDVRRALLPALPRPAHGLPGGSEHPLADELRQGGLRRQRDRGRRDQRGARTAYPGAGRHDGRRRATW